MFSIFRNKFILISIVILIGISAILVPKNKVYSQQVSNIEEFPIAGGLFGIASGPDGNLWISSFDATAKIYKVSPNGAVMNTYSIPTDISYAMGQGITSGPDGNIWFTERGANKIGRITPDGLIDHFSIPTKSSYPTYITSGPDGNIWFTEQVVDKIGRITPAGVITEYPLPVTSSSPFGLMPTGITSGPDGNIWFTEGGNYGNKIGRITPGGVITEFSLPTPNSYPESIISGPDGNLWFTEKENNKIGRITPTGVITEFSVPTNNSWPLGITSGPDGHIWFTEYFGNKIGRIDMEGNITEYALPIHSGIANSNPAGITTGPDGNIWFTENSNLKMGRVNLMSVIPSVTTTPTPTPTPPNNDNILNVPYFSQNALPWGPSEYDSSQSLGFSNYTMDRWGCAVTSVAMVLSYHNIKQFADGTPIDPGSLNLWLKNNKGYVTGYGKDGSYSYFNWPVIGKLTKELFNAGKSSIKLEHRRAYPGPQTTETLNHDLTVGNSISKFPDILWVSNSLTSGHFVVAKGVKNNTYAINDPEWNYPDLSAFNNTYMQVDRYVPSNTNLSYLSLVANPNVEILITDSQGRKTGEYVHDGIRETYNEIPGASYAYESPIINTDAIGIQEYLGTGVNALLLPEPAEGEYQITISGNNSTNYTINVLTIQADGDNQVNTTEGTVAPNNDNIFTVQYFQAQASSINKTVGFQSIIDDINELYVLNLITHKSVTNNLIRNIQQAQNASLSGDTAKILQNLDQFITVLNRERGRRVTDRAYNVLFADSVSLKQKYAN